MNEKIINTSGFCPLKSRLVAYAVALVGAVAGFFLREVITHFTGPDLATFITFYPVLILVAVFVGLGPSLLTIVLSALIVDYWFFPPYRTFGLSKHIDAIEIALFLFMGVLINVGIEFYRRRNEEQKEKLHLVSSYSRTLLEASLDPFVLISHEGRITDVNEATTKVMGISKESLIGTDFSSYFTEPKKAEEGYRQAFSRGFVLDYPLTIQHKSGKLVDVLYNASVYKDDEGNVLGVFAAARDITAQKNAEQKLRGSYAELEEKIHTRTQDFHNATVAVQNVLEDLSTEREKLGALKAKDEAILASVGDGLVATDMKGRIMLVNAAFEKMLGWKETEIQHKLLVRVVTMIDENGEAVPSSERPINVILKNSSKTDTTIFTTSYYKRRDGTVFPVVITIAPIFAEGEFIGVVETFRDITKEKAVDKAKTEFVSLASHQLRTPLSAINWYTEMLLTGDVGKLNLRQKKYLDEVSRGSRRMVSLVNDLLNVSRLELGTFMIEPELTDISKIIQSVINEQRMGIDAKQMKVSLALGEDVPLISIDPKLMRMIVGNILSNAVKYSAEGGEIKISLSLEDSKGILLKVSDMGCGIPKGQQDKIFTKLFRADNARERNTEGTGLGLYIAKTVIDNSGGNIWFTSEEDKGSTFFVTIPLGGMRKKEGIKTLI